MKDYVLQLGPCGHRPVKEGDGWDAGDQVIQEGIYKLLPELSNVPTVVSSVVKPEEIDECVKNCKYVIQMGTPSWPDLVYRAFWRACATHKKHISFIGIGLAVEFNSDFWYGREDFMELQRSDLIDHIVCRDKYCYYWLLKRCGFLGSKIKKLPCPGFYVLPMRHVTAKKRVVISIANPQETSISQQHAYHNLFEHYNYICNELEKRGAEVFVIYQRCGTNYMGFLTEYHKIVKRPLIWFQSPHYFEQFFSDKQIYIGFRNHGALPCAGAGMPSLLLGTDYRQALAEEIPFLSKIDVSHAALRPEEIFNWYYALDPNCISKSLTNWRNVTMDLWKPVLDDIKEKIL